MLREYRIYLKEKVEFDEAKAIFSSFFNIDEITKIDDHTVKFCGDDIIKSTITKSIQPLSNDLNSALLILISPVDFPLSEYVLSRLSLSHSEGVYTLSQGIIELLLKKDEFIKNYLFSWFSGIEYTLAITGKTYIENSFSISKSCLSLSVHRNTMEYRLKKIKELYNLDLSCFDDGILFLTYLNLSGICA